MSVVLKQQEEIAGFFEIVRKLEFEARSDGRIADGEIRFRAPSSLRFPAGDATANAGDIAASMMGMLGASGALPLHYTEKSIAAERDGGALFLSFLNVIDHRFIRLFYEAWAKYQAVIVAERTGDAGNAFVGALTAACGLFSPGLAGAGRLNERQTAGLSGALQRRAGAIAIGRLCASLSGAPVMVQEFAGGWSVIAQTERTRLGQAFSRLGDDAVAGDATWEAGGAFCVRIGPLSAETFDKYVLEADDLGAIAATTRMVVDPALSLHFRLLIDGADVPPLRLGDASRPVRLGLSAWLGGRNAGVRDDTVVMPRLGRTSA